MTEIVLYSGKGGVGKTTIAAASGVQAAQEGRETLVVSTDPAHSLADSVGTAVGGEPTEIRENLWGVEVDPQQGIDRYRALFEELASEFSSAGIRMDEDEISSLFTSGVMPGSDELAALEALATYLGDERWDLIIFDTAPTGHTLRLLDLPTVMDRGVATALDLREQVRRKVDTARSMFFGPMARRTHDEADDFTELRARMEQVRTALRDPERTSFRVVTIPETMAVRETERLVERLREFGIPVTGIVVNKVIEDAGDCERCQAKQAVHDRILERLRDDYADLDLLTVPDVAGEVTGMDALEDLGIQFEQLVA